MDACEVIRTIEVAFDGVERSTTSLRQFLLTDKFGMSREITGKEWALAGKARVDSEWQQIPDSEIEECDCLLAHMAAEEFRYYLPAYMRYSVTHYQSPIWATDILGFTVFSLFPSPKNNELDAYNVAQFALLNSAQKSAIVRFLTFVANMEGDVRQPGAIKALNQYWEKADV